MAELRLVLLLLIFLYLSIKIVSMNNVLETTAPVNNELQIDMLQFKKAILTLRAVNHKLRQQMLNLLHQNKRLTVTEVYIKLRLEQSVASQHLAVLRKAGFVTTSRDGKFIYYSVNHSRLDQAHEFIRTLLK